MPKRKTEPAKQHIYYVTYGYRHDDSMGIASISIMRPKKIKTPEDIAAIEEFIKETRGDTSIVILSWNKLSKKRMMKNGTAS